MVIDDDLGASTTFYLYIATARQSPPHSSILQSCVSPSMFCQLRGCLPPQFVAKEPCQSRPYHTSKSRRADHLAVRLARSLGWAVLYRSKT